MDARRFDRIAVVVGGATGRRTAIRLLAGGVVAALVPGRGGVARGQQACAPPCVGTDHGCCDEVCLPLNTTSHCGACDAACEPGDACGECKAYDPEETDLFRDCSAASPGQRFRCCAEDRYNSNGACCSLEEPPAVNCCTTADAARGRCQPVCLPLTAVAGRDDPVLIHNDHCGRCGNRCTGGKQCRDGACVCPDGTQVCGNGTCAAPGGCCTGDSCPPAPDPFVSSCGDGACTGSETCSSCPQDCGPCCTSDSDCPIDSGQVCPGPGRVCQCPTGERDCNGRCLPNDRCCSNADCPGATFCPNPGAVCQCPNGQRNCNGRCQSSDLCCTIDDCEGGGRCCPDGTCKQCCHIDHCFGQRCCDGTCQECCRPFDCHSEQTCCFGVCKDRNAVCRPPQ
jgi:hypothetical protein